MSAAPRAVLADAAVLIADGGRVTSDLAVLRDQPELFGSVASDTTLWRAFEESGPDQRDRSVMPTIRSASSGGNALVNALTDTRSGNQPSGETPTDPSCATP